MKFILEIECEGAGFDPTPVFMVANILKSVANRMWSRPDILENKELQDTNGNTCGSMKWVR